MNNTIKKIILTESQFNFLIEAASLDDIHNKYYSNIDNDVFMQIISADPTYDYNKPQKMGKYGKWLLNLYLSNNLDTSQLNYAKSFLWYFTKYYNVIENKDITKYRTLSDLYNAIFKYMDSGIATSHSDEIRRIKQGANKVYEDSDWLIVMPTTEEASCYYGKNTQWCTAANSSDNYFDHYYSKGNLYINIDKKNNKKYQFHFEKDEFMDELNDKIQSPIADTINMTNGALEWYKQNVKKWESLLKERITVLETESCHLYLYKSPIDKYWSLYDEFRPRKAIAKNIVFDKELAYENDAYNEYGYYLEVYGYTTFDNAKGKQTLVIYDKQIDYAFSGGYNYTYLNTLDVDCTYSDYGYESMLENIISNKTYEILAIPDNFSLYSISLKNYKETKIIDAVIIQVIRKDGLCDLISSDNGKVLTGINCDFETDKCEYIRATNENGEEILVDFITLEEINDEDNE